MDCYDVTTDARSVSTAARYATTLMPDGVLAGASGWRLGDDGRAGGIKNPGKVS